MYFLVEEPNTTFNILSDAINETEVLSLIEFEEEQDITLSYNEIQIENTTHNAEQELTADLSEAGLIIMNY